MQEKGDLLKSCTILPLVTGLVGLAIMSVLQGCGPSTRLPPVGHLAYILIAAPGIISPDIAWHLDVSVPTGSGVFRITQEQLASTPAGPATLEVGQLYQYSGKTQDADTSFGYLKYYGGFTTDIPLNFRT